MDLAARSDHRATPWRRSRAPASPTSSSRPTTAQKTYKERALKIGAHHVANLVTALCTPAAKGITGQLLGVRGREVFLFGQPRPVAQARCREARDARAADLIAKLGAKFTDMTHRSRSLQHRTPRLKRGAAMTDIVVKTVEELKSAPEEYRDGRLASS